MAVVWEICLPHIFFPKQVDQIAQLVERKYVHPEVQGSSLSLVNLAVLPNITGYEWEDRDVVGVTLSSNLHTNLSEIQIGIQCQIVSTDNVLVTGHRGK